MCRQAILAAGHGYYGAEIVPAGGTAAPVPACIAAYGGIVLMTWRNFRAPPLRMR
jgi:hypothetical protein